MIHVCRTCLQIISDLDFIVLNDESKSSLIKKKLDLCVPELTLNLLSDPLMCSSCIKELSIAYNFRRRCLQIEHDILSIDNKDLANIALLSTESPLSLNANIAVDVVENPCSNTCWDVPNQSQGGDSAPVIIIEQAQEETEKENVSENKEYTIFDDEFDEGNFDIEYDDMEEQSDGEHTKGSDSSVIEVVADEVSTLVPLQVALLNLMDSDKLYNSQKCSSHNLTIPNGDSTTAGCKRRQNILSHKCNNCLCKTTSKDQFLLVHQDKPYCCPKCPYRASLKTTLRYHIMNHNSDRPFKCSACQMSFSRKIHLNAHLKTHTGETPFACNECDYKTIHKGNLTQHMSVHRSERPFKCTFCQYNTKRKSMLRVHMMSHTKEKPHTCSKCSYSTATSYLMQKHLLMHEREQLLACSVCEFTTYKTMQLKLHMAEHSKQYIFECDD